MAPGVTYHPHSGSSDRPNLASTGTERVRGRCERTDDVDDHHGATNSAEFPTGQVTRCLLHGEIVFTNSGVAGMPGCRQAHRSRNC